jgi:hypothetical protein
VVRVLGVLGMAAWLVAACVPILGEYSVEEDCADIGEGCEDDDGCCPADSRPRHCFDPGDGKVCADACAGGYECNSTCCAPTEGGGWACAPLSFCEDCVETGQPCVQSGQCCSFRLEMGFCVGMGSGGSVCAETCTQPNDCVSNCCAPLESGGSVCAPSQFC